MNEEMERWEKKEGTEFLRRVGIRKKQIVLDFGCGVGHYTIPAARIVGKEGFVYAVDKELQTINELEQKAKANNFKNVKVTNTSGQMKLPLENRAVDVILLYDILHCLSKDERAKLYHETFRLLKRDGFLSVLSKAYSGR